MPVLNKICLPHHENSDLKEVYYSKLTQYSQGNNVLDALASNIYCFLWRVTCVSST
jgi:hypothetical protein